MTDPREAILSRKLDTLPAHVAIIMDGNNRWAKNHSVSGAAGHKAGVDAVRAVIETAVHYQIPALTLFAFSSENWRRPPLEVKALMDLFAFVLKREVSKLHDNNIRLRIIGNVAGLSLELQKLIVLAEQKTLANTGLQLSIAANYGGRWDILEAAKAMALELQEQGADPASVSEDDFASYLCLSELPAIDLCIRTSGEQRISNFLLWQMAYAELVFVDTLWPEFKHQKMVDTLVQFGQRQRRFGQTGAQIIEQESNV